MLQSKYDLVELLKKKKQKRKPKTKHELSSDTASVTQWG